MIGREPNMFWENLLFLGRHIAMEPPLRLVREAQL